MLLEEFLFNSQLFAVLQSTIELIKDNDSMNPWRIQIQNGQLAAII